MCFKAFITVHTIKCIHHQDTSSKTTRIKDKESKIALYTFISLTALHVSLNLGLGLARFPN